MLPFLSLINFHILSNSCFFNENTLFFTLILPNLSQLVFWHASKSLPVTNRTTVPNKLDHGQIRVRCLGDLGRLFDACVL